jgi:hypothetical protein
MRCTLTKNFKRQFNKNVDEYNLIAYPIRKAHPMTFLIGINVCGILIVFLFSPHYRKRNKELLDTHKRAVDTERETITKIEEQLQKLILKAHIPSS